MRLAYSPRFLRHYHAAPSTIQRAFDQKSRFLLFNLQHPSIRAKKYDERRGIWQGRVTKNWRFYFTIEGDIYQLLDIVAHPK